MKLSILVPVYNELYTVAEVIGAVLAVRLPEGLDREVIAVDDCSADGTWQVLQDIAQQVPLVRVFRQDRNRGKGAAIRAAIEHATGDIMVIQDADLEYDPDDLPRLVKPIMEGHADAVFGSRFMSGESRRVLYFWHSLGNRFLTTVSNCFTNLNLTDMETCYKMVRAELMKSIPLRCDRFGIEPEITAKLARRGCRIYEVPVRYRGRTYQEGKKITWWDGVKALATIIRFAGTADLYREGPVHDTLMRLSGARRFNRWMSDTIAPWVGSKVLEIGAGMGNISTQLMPRFEYTCSDIDPHHLRYLSNMFAHNRRVRVARIDLLEADDFSRLSGEFDTIVCLNVLEHVRDDQLALRNVASRLSLDGRLVLLVPRAPALFGSLDVALQHVRRYEEDGLRAKLADAGLHVEKMFTFNRIGVPAWLFNGRVLRRRSFGRMQLRVLDSMTSILRRVDAWLPWKGLSIIAIARKPAVPLPN